MPRRAKPKAKTASASKSKPTPTPKSNLPARDTTDDLSSMSSHSEPKKDSAPNPVDTLSDISIESAEASEETKEQTKPPAPPKEKKQKKEKAKAVPKPKSLPVPKAKKRAAVRPKETKTADEPPAKREYRGKQKLESFDLIEDKKYRATTLARRKKTLLQKGDELTKLTGASVLVLIKHPETNKVSRIGTGDYKNLFENGIEMGQATSKDILNQVSQTVNTLFEKQNKEFEKNIRDAYVGKMTDFESKTSKKLSAASVLNMPSENEQDDMDSMCADSDAGPSNANGKASEDLFDL